VWLLEIRACYQSLPPPLFLFIELLDMRCYNAARLASLTHE